MSIQFLSGIDLDLNEVKNMTVEKLSAHPDPTTSRFYFNSTDHKFYGHDGTQWIDLTNRGWQPAVDSIEDLELLSNLEDGLVVYVKDTDKMYSWDEPTSSWIRPKYCADEIDVEDSGGYFGYSDNVEEALQEIGSKLDDIDVDKTTYVADWDNTVEYMTGDACYYNGKFYKSTSDNNIDNQPDISNWEEITVEGVQLPDIEYGDANKVVFVAETEDGFEYKEFDIDNIDASKITSGVFDIARIPSAALERLVIVDDETARFNLTTDTVQNGDTVKEEDTKLMYFVIDDTNLNNENGYKVYTAGRVDWGNIEGNPIPNIEYGDDGKVLKADKHTGEFELSEITESDITNLDKYTQTEVDNLLNAKQDNLPDIEYGDGGKFLAVNDTEDGYIYKTFKFEVIYIRTNQEFVAGGGTEFILRTGSAVIVDPQQKGVSDLTDGENLQEGDNVPRNHLLLSPRDDGRGLIAQQNIYLMVKGTYTIE